MTCAGISQHCGHYFRKKSILLWRFLRGLSLCKAASGIGNLSMSRLPARRALVRSSKLNAKRRGRNRRKTSPQLLEIFDSNWTVLTREGQRSRLTIHLRNAADAVTVAIEGLNFAVLFDE
jgi:hypothetical protein